MSCNGYVNTEKLNLNVHVKQNNTQNSRQDVLSPKLNTNIPLFLRRSYPSLRKIHGNLKR